MSSEPTDAITVNGTDGVEDVVVAGGNGDVDVLGLSTAIRIRHPEVANDSLAINTLGGHDNVVINGSSTTLIQTIVDLGADQ